jgi:short-subunit dehydrogenase
MAKQPRILAGQTAAVTGAARGIGRATAQALIGRGMKVAIGDLDEQAARRTAEELGRSALALPLDVTDRGSFAAFLDGAEERLGALDVLVNNAGIMPLGPVLKEPDAVTRKIFDVNVFGIINGTKAVAPGMVDRGHGHIVNVASAVGRVPVADGASYAASKFAAVGFSESTRLELKPHGIDVTVVLPGIVRTELAAGVPDARGVKSLKPEDVAAVIESAIRKPRPELWVPTWTRGMAKATGILPLRVQEAIGRAFKADRVMSDADPVARAAYEERARRS